MAKLASHASSASITPPAGLGIDVELLLDVELPLDIELVDEEDDEEALDDFQLFIVQQIVTKLQDFYMEKSIQNYSTLRQSQGRR